MIVLALRLLGWGKIALRAAVGVFTRYPLHCALAMLLCLSAWLWRGWNHERAARKADAVAFQQASDEARTKQEALRAKEKAEYESKADGSQSEHVAARPASDTASLAHIRANRVRTNGCSAPVPVDQAGDPAIPAPVPSEAVVVASEDVLTCGRLYDYALDAHNWAVSVSQ